MPNDKNNFCKGHVKDRSSCLLVPTMQKHTHELSMANSSSSEPAFAMLLQDVNDKVF